jgi:hypothetical protein
VCVQLCSPEDADGWSIEKGSIPKSTPPIQSLPMDVPDALKTPLKPKEDKVELKVQRASVADVLAGRVSATEAVHATLGVLKTFKKMMIVWPLSVLGCVAAGFIIPVIPFISLNFFARQYTTLSPSDIHCDVDPSVSYCQKANVESVHYMCLATSLGAILQILSGPVLGSFSDAYGRKKIIIIICFLQLLPVMFLYAHVTGVITFWIVLVFYPFLNLPFLPVYFTIAVDILITSDDRAIAFNLIIAIESL